MRKINSEFKTSFVSEEGTFLKNRDYFAFVELDNYACYVVCDGIDEDKELESAKIAVTSFIKQFTERPTLNRFLLKKYIKNTNEELLAASRYTRLKASIMIAVTNYSKVRYIQAGNARFYLFKDGYLNHVSKDQSLTQEMAEDGLIALDKMAKHKERNNLTSFLGKSELGKIIISKRFKLHDGDIFTIATRGIWENCDEKEMEDAIEGVKEPSELVDRVEDMILSRQTEVLENYTLAAVFASRCYLDPNKKEKIKKALMIGIPVALIIIILVVVIIIFKHRRSNALESMRDYKESAEKYLVGENYDKANADYKEALDIAKKYKFKEEISELDDDYRYTDMVLAADKDLKDKKYDDALDKYMMALEDCGDAGSYGNGYIEKKIDVVKNCINVSDLLVLGDKQLEDNDLDGAEKTYLEAKKDSNDAYLKDERQEALDKLKDIYDKKAQDKAANDAAQAQAQAAADQAKKDSEDKLSKAIDNRKTGDDKYVSADYVSARMYYTLALQGFQEAGVSSMVEEMQEKIVLMDKKINETADAKAEADRYLEEANTRLASGDKDSAKVLYTLAKEKYTALGLSNDASSIDSKISALG